MGIYFAWNYHQFGNPFDFGYPEYASGKRLNGFETPVLHGLLGFLVSPGKSIFIFAPIILLAMRGLPDLFRRDRGLAVVSAGAPIIYLLLYSGYTQWEGGYCFGPRYMLPATVLMLFSLVPWLESAAPIARRTFLSLVIVGALVQGVGLATSFLEDQYSNRYYDSHYNYQTSYSPLVSQSALFFHYVLSLNLTEQAAPLGKGFDRWFVFLGKAGVSSVPIFLLLSIIAAVAVATGLLLARQLLSPLREIQFEPPNVIPASS